MEDRYSNTNPFHERNPYQATSDAQAWLDFLGGNKAAYSHIYRRHFAALYNYGYKFVQNRSLTEDCIQDVFLYILEHRESLSPTDSVKFYLFKALRSQIVKRIKKQFSTERLETDEEEHFHVSFSYEYSWLETRIACERNEQLLEALSQLPARQKEAIFLRFYEGLTFAEIAALMEVEQTSVYKAIYKGFATLQKKISLRSLLVFGLLFCMSTDWQHPKLA